MLLVAGRVDSPLHRLPSEALHLIFERVAEKSYWDLEFALRLAEDPALREPPQVENPALQAFDHVQDFASIPAVSSAFTALDL